MTSKTITLAAARAAARAANADYREAAADRMRIFAMKRPGSRTQDSLIRLMRAARAADRADKALAEAKRAAKRAV